MKRSAAHLDESTSNFMVDSSEWPKFWESESECFEFVPESVFPEVVILDSDESPPRSADTRCLVPDYSFTAVVPRCLVPEMTVDSATPPRSAVPRCLAPDYSYAAVVPRCLVPEMTVDSATPPRCAVSRCLVPKTTVSAETPHQETTGVDEAAVTRKRIMAWAAAYELKKKSMPPGWMTPDEQYEYLIDECSRLAAKREEILAWASHI